MVEGEDAVWLNVIKVQAVTGEAYVNVRKVRCCGGSGGAAGALTARRVRTSLDRRKATARDSLCHGARWCRGTDR